METTLCRGKLLAQELGGKGYTGFVPLRWRDSAQADFSPPSDGSNFTMKASAAESRRGRGPSIVMVS